MNRLAVRELKGIALSRSNLEGLLAQLNASGVAMIRRRIDGEIFVVTAEEDDVHYAGREAGVSGP